MKKFLLPVVAFAFLAILARPSIAQRDEPSPSDAVQGKQEGNGTEPSPVALAQGQNAGRGEKEYREEPGPGPLQERRAAPRAGSPNVGFGYVTSLGAFDLTPNGILQFIVADRFYVEKAYYYDENDRFWYFREVDHPNWFWAFDKEPRGDGGLYRVFVSVQQPTWILHSKGVRAPKW